jgi:hypothetical protein
MRCDVGGALCDVAGAVSPLTEWITAPGGGAAALDGAGRLAAAEGPEARSSLLSSGPAGARAARLPSTPGDRRAGGFTSGVATAATAWA